MLVLLCLQVLQHNAACVDLLFQPEQVHHVPMKITPTMTEDHMRRDPFLHRWLRRKFHFLPKVAVGARVMLTDNVCLAKGMSNGAQGTVVALHFGDDGQVCSMCCATAKQSLTTMLLYCCAGPAGRCGAGCQAWPGVCHVQM